MKPNFYIKPSCGKPHPQNKDIRNDEIFCDRSKDHPGSHAGKDSDGRVVYW